MRGWGQKRDGKRKGEEEEEKKKRETYPIDSLYSHD